MKEAHAVNTSQPREGWHRSRSPRVKRQKLNLQRQLELIVRQSPALEHSH